MRRSSAALVLTLFGFSFSCADDTRTDGGDSAGETGADVDGDGDGDSGDTGDGDGDGDGDTTGDGDGDTSGDGDTTGDGDCEPWTLICEYTAGDMETIDCGIVTDDDDQAAWQAAHDCAVAAAADTAAFKVMGQTLWNDSPQSDAYGAVQGLVYGPVWIHHDIDVGALHRDCADIIAASNCVVVPSNLCLECLEPSLPTQLCD